MIVIGLSGKARTGKSSLTRQLYSAAEQLGWDVEVAPFAGPLKRAAAKKHGYSDVAKFKEEMPDVYRSECQATGAGERAKDPDHWVKLWMDDIAELRKMEMDIDNPLLVLVDDVRYQNEIDALAKGGGTTCFVKHGKRPIDDPTGEWRKHESELIANELETLDDQDIKLRGYKYVIHNDGPEDELSKWAKKFVEVAAVDALEWECTCEACLAVIENRPVDSRKVDNEIERLLDRLEDKLREKEEDNED